MSVESGPGQPSDAPKTIEQPVVDAPKTTEATPAAEAGGEQVPSGGGPQPAQQQKQVQNIPASDNQQIVPTGQPQDDDDDDKAVTLPETEEELKVDAKGDIEDSKTWDATFWLRKMEKYLLKGWIVHGRGASKIK